MATTEAKDKVINDTKNNVAKETDPKVAQAKGAEETADSVEVSKTGYDEWHNKMKEERAIEGGAQFVGSGLEKGRPIKEDGTLDTDQPSLFEQRFSEESADDKKKKS